MLKCIDEQALSNGLNIILYDTLYSFWIVISNKEGNLCENSIKELEKMAWKIEREVKNKHTGIISTVYTIRCYSKKTYLSFLEYLKEFS